MTESNPGDGVQMTTGPEDQQDEVEETSTGCLGRRWDNLDFSKGTDCKRTFSEDR
jgi:hypothetical protein